MRGKSKHRKMRCRFMLCCLLVVLVAGGYVFSSRLESAMHTFASTKGNALLTLELQNSLYDRLQGKTEEYVHVTRDANERIASVQIDSVGISLLASELTMTLLDTVQNYQNTDFGIPLGNLTGSALLSGHGPLIPVRPVAAGNVASEMQSSLTAAGINQTLHRVSLHFVVAISYLAPLENCTESLSFDIVLAETLIVGEVPILYR